MVDPNPTTGYQQDDGFEVGNLQIAAYMFAGLAMMLNIRLSYSAAPFALLRFKLPENLFSVFVRTTSSALELWCIPSMLIGNIMEQVYNKTQDTIGPHTNELKNKSTKIQKKASQLKGTADSQSTNELTRIRDSDIRGNDNKGGQLKAKAEQLRGNAEKLYGAAETLRSEAAQGELVTLSVPVINLKNAAGTAGGGDNLYNAAQQLASHSDGQGGLEQLATNVINKFDKVNEYYESLSKINEYKDVIEGNSSLTQQQQQKVKGVDSSYKLLKFDYDRMLNLTKLAVKATILAGKGATLTGLQHAADQLASNVKALRDTPGSSNDYSNAKTVITQFEKVESAYSELSETDKPSVKNHSEAVKTVYNSTFKFTKIKYYSEQLESEAKNLSTSSDPKKVITKYQKVVESYKALGDSEKKHVEDAYNALQTVYSDAIYKYKFHFLTIPSMITNWLNFLTFVILLIVFVTGGEQGHVTGYYIVMAISGFVFGINMVLVYAIDYRYLPFYMAGENSFPMVTSLILYFATSIFGNRRKYNSDYLVVVIDVSIAIVIAFVASVLWTVAFYKYRATMSSDLTPDPWNLISPVAMVIVGMGLVYSIYPGIAPGMIVPFYLIDKIEMVLLIATAFPPVIIAILRKYAENWSPSTKFLFSNFNMGGWKQYTDNDGKTTVYGWIWHFFDILIPLQITLAVIFIYSIHYRDSSISRAIVNQPKMSTFLSIIFYMCHEILLALGFPGMVGNGGAGGAVLLPTQYVGALLMVFLAFYSIGYITEYKRHDPSQWPTDGMSKWNSVCYWLKMASKITNKNFKQLFTTD